MSTSQYGPVLALDIGDTNIAGSMITIDDQITSLRNVSTMAQQGGEAVLQRVISLAEELRQGNLQIALGAVAVSSVGLIDTATGTVSFAPASLPGWQNMPIRERLEQALQLPTYVINVGQATALGEAIFGAGRGYRRVVSLTVSNHICGGLVVDGKLYYGADGSAGAVGHLIIDYQERRRCSCGRYGCLEAYAAAPVVIADFLRAMGRNRIRIELNRKRRQIGVEEVADLVRLGHAEALAAIERGAHFLGIGLATIANLLNPDVIIVGGNMAQIGDAYFSLVRQVIRERALPNVADIPVVPAILGIQANLLGVACLAQQGLESLDHANQ
jgi:glucokinase